MSIKKRIIKIENLFCLICEDRLSIILDKLNGIKKYVINVYTREIFIVFDSTTISFQKILKVLSSSGFLFTRIKILDRKYFLVFLLLTIIKISMFCDFAELTMLNLGFTSILQFCNIQEVYKSLKTFNITNTVLIHISSFLCFFYGTLGYILDFEYKSECFSMINLSSNILIFIYINKYILEMTIQQSKISLFQIKEYKKHKMKKIEKSENNEIKVYKVDMQYIKNGDHIILRDDTTILVDGFVFEGECFVDESNITGEQNLKKKCKGGILYAGSYLQKGSIVLQVTGVGKNTFVSKIYNCVNEASFQFMKKNMTKKYKYFTKFIIALSFSVFFIYLYLGFQDEIPAVLTDNSENIYLISFKMFLSTIIISCPCVFLLSEPLLGLRMRKIMIKNGIIIKNYKNLDACPSVIFFDKTGTLTKSNLSILEYKIYENDSNLNSSEFTKLKSIIDKELLLRIIKTLEKSHRHPISYSFCQLLDKYQTVSITNSEYCPGKGVRCKYNEHEIRLGNYSFTGYKNKESSGGIKKLYLKGKVIYVSVNGKVIGYFLCEEFIEESCYNVIEELKKMNYKLVILSGDEKENVRNVANKLKIDTYYHSQTAKSKLDLIKQYKHGGHSTMMVGDGINDVPSFNIADISISLNFQNDMADIVMLTKDISKISFIVKKFRQNKFKMVINYLVSISYNSVALPSVIGLLLPYKIYISIEHSCFSMLLSSCFIILNSLAY